MGNKLRRGYLSFLDMVQEKEYFAFISYKRRIQLKANCLPCLASLLLRASFGVSLVLLWMSYGTLMWIHCAFEEDSKVMRRYTQLTDRSS